MNCEQRRQLTYRTRPKANTNVDGQLGGFNELTKHVLAHRRVRHTRDSRGTAGEFQGGFVRQEIVTAQKREQSLQDVPIVVTTISEQLLQDTGVQDIKDLTLLTPGLIVTSTTSETVTTARIRGIGTVGDNPGLESSVGVVIDGVYRPRNGVSFGDLGELDQQRDRRQQIQQMLHA